VWTITVFDSGLYAVLDYRVQHSQLPLGEIPVVCRVRTPGGLSSCSSVATKD